MVVFYSPCHILSILDRGLVVVDLFQLSYQFFFQHSVILSLIDLVVRSLVLEMVHTENYLFI